MDMSPLSISNLFSVKNYVAVVSGGSSGLGFMICKVIPQRLQLSSNKRTKCMQGLVVNGAKVYLVALPTEPIEDRVTELCDLGRTSGGSAIG